MASSNAYATSLRHDRGREDKAVESGVPFFVPHLTKVKTNVMCQAKQSQHLLFSFEKDDAASPVATSYRKQGDQELYSEDNLRKRRQLLYDRQVVGAIGRFWDTFPVVRQGAVQIEQPDYVDVFVKLYKALVAPSEFSVAEAKRIVEKDWNKDVGSDPTIVMTKDMFNRALFEVADIWTVGIGSDEYSSFLTKLFKRVTMTIYDNERSRWVTVFQELDRIRSFATADEDPMTSEFVNVVTTAMTSSTSTSSTTLTAPTSATPPASSASKPPRAPLVKRKSQKIEEPASSAATTSNELPPTPTRADAKQSRRRQDSILPMSLSSEGSKTFTPPITQLQLGGARSQAKRSDDGDDDDNNSSTTTGSNEMPLTTRSDAPYRSVRRPQFGPRAKDRGDSFESDGDDDDADSDANDNDLDQNNDDDKASIAGARSSRSIVKRQLQRSASTKSETTSSNHPRRKFGGLLSKGPTPTSPTRPMLPELPTQHIHLTMPNIYLSPDLTQPQATERAARRRMRKSAKLAQRLRRITF